MTAFEADATVVPLHNPVLTDWEEARLLEAFRSGWISGHGPHVDAFEKALGRHFGGLRASAASSGTAALHLALKALDIGPGDEVLVPDLTYIAVANAVVYCGATPVPCDAHPGYWNLDPRAVEAAITPRTAAVIAVHGFGHPADMPALLRAAAPRGIPVIEDVSQAFGARCEGRLAGTFGTLSIHSFFANKILTTGEGGVVMTGDARLHERVARLRNQCETPQKKYEHDTLGYSYRLGNLQAAIGLAQLERLDEVLAARGRVLSLYRAGLEGIEDLRLNPFEPWATPVNWMVCLETSADRVEAVKARLASRNIEFRRAFTPLSGQPSLKGLLAGAGGPEAARLADRILMLPSGSGLSGAEIARVCDAVRDGCR